LCSALHQRYWEHTFHPRTRAMSTGDLAKCADQTKGAKEGSGISGRKVYGSSVAKLIELYSLLK
jgi:hypothetical protein